MEKVNKFQLGVSSFQEIGVPLMTALLGDFLSKHQYWEVIWLSAIGLFGVYMSCEQEKVNEIIKFIEENPNVFAQKYVETEAFREGFLRILESYLKTRGDTKKQKIRRLLLGFTKIEDKETFELEKLLSLIDVLSVEDVEILKIYIDGSLINWWGDQCGGEQKKVEEDVWTEFLNVYQIGKLVLSDINGHKQFEDTLYTKERLDYLKGIGLMTQSIQHGGLGTGGGDNLDYRPSKLARKFIEMILEREI